MLLKADALEAIKAGRIDMVFRVWRRPTVKAGGTLTTAAGVLAIDSVETIAPEAVTAAEAKRAGFETLAAFGDWLDQECEGQLYRIAVRYVGADPRVALRHAAKIGTDELAEIEAKLRKLDGKGPWVEAVMRAIAEQPGVAAQVLAEAVGLEKLDFKGRVRRLKALGLTESLEIGYRLSPRGEAVMRLWGRAATASA